MSQEIIETSAVDADSLRAALRRLPGWRLYRRGEGLRYRAEFGGPTQAASCALSALLLGFRFDCLPEVRLTGSSVTLTLLDPSLRSVTQPQLELARTLNILFGPRAGSSRGKR